MLGIRELTTRPGNRGLKWQVEARRKLEALRRCPVRSGTSSGTPIPRLSKNTQRLMTLLGFANLMRAEQYLAHLVENQG